MTDRTMTKTIAAAALTLLGAMPATAQLTNPSAASVGMAGSYTVMARGLSAISWNPAGLAMPGASGFAISLLPLNAVAGLDPVSLADVAEYQDTIIPNDVKQEWLDEIITEGSQQGNGGLGLTYLALKIWRFGFQVGTSTVATADIDPGVARLLLFGNADGDSAITVTGGANEMNLGVVSSAALSYAHPLTLSLGPLPDQRFALGATVKYVVGHFLVSGFDTGSRADTDPLEVVVQFPTIRSFATDTTDDGSESDDDGMFPSFGTDGIVGTGIGLDLGAMWQGGIFSAAVTIQNLINTFAWHEEELYYSPGEMVFNEDTTTTDFETRPLSEAPAELRARLDDLGFPPIVAIGGAVQLPMIKLSAEIRHRSGESLSLETGTHAGVGAEFRPIRFIPIRAGVATVNGGYNLGAGLGLEFRAVNLNVGGNLRSSDLGTDYTGALTVSFGGI